MGDHKVDLQLPRLRELLTGQPAWTKALIETLDVDVDAGGDLTQWDLDEAADGVERLLSRHPAVSRRIVSSQHPSLRGIASMRMSEAMLSRISDMGLNPAGVAAIGLLGLGCVMALDGRYEGLTLEPEATRDVDGTTLWTPSLILGGTVWDGHDDDLTLLGHVLPQSACMLATGMGLDDLVDTPLTRGLGLVVRDASSDEGSGATTIRLVPGPYAAIAGRP